MKKLLLLFTAFFVGQTSYAGWVINQLTHSKSSASKKPVLIESDMRITQGKMRIDFSSREKGQQRKHSFFSTPSNSHVCFATKNGSQCTKFVSGGSLSFLAGMQSMGMKLNYNKLSITANGKSRKVMGYPCTPYKVVSNINGSMGKMSDMNIQVTQSGCYSKAVAYKEFQAVSSALNESVKKLFPSPKLQSEYKKLVSIGIPLEENRVTQISGKLFKSKTEDRMKTRTIKQKNLPNSVFQLPKGHKVVQLPNFTNKRSATPTAPEPVPAADGERRISNVPNNKALKKQLKNIMRK